MLRLAFDGGDDGAWRVRSLEGVIGAALPIVSRLAIQNADIQTAPHGGPWRLQAQISNLRYATRSEVVDLRSRQEPLGRKAARYAALIPIRKSASWWSLAQDERRAIFEADSRHTQIGLAYLPAVARQLYHARDLGEPFDFLTWFEFSPADEPAFNELLQRLRATAEWRFVEREVDIRLERDDGL